jgi:hypothetical protein
MTHRSGWRAAAAVAAGLVVWASGAMVAPSAEAAPASASSTLSLVAQTATVSSGGSFNLDVHLSSAVSGSDHVDVGIYPQLTSRSAFDQAAAGQLNNEDPYYFQQDISIARRTAAGNLGLSVAVAPRSPQGHQLQQEFQPVSTTTAGVYPVVVQVFSSVGAAVGSPLTTFLVYSPAKTGYEKLAVSLTVPINAAPNVTSSSSTGDVPSATASSLSATVDALADRSGVPVTLAVTPQTATALASGTAQDKSAVAGLRRLVKAGDELTSTPYVSASIPGLDNAGLDSQIDSQLNAGSNALRTDLGAAPETSTWVMDEPFDTTALQLLMQRGLKDLVLPDADLSALPAADQTYPYEMPSYLQSGVGRAKVKVVGADTITSGRLATSSDPVLAAEQILAELAMVKLEYPGAATTKSVAIVPPKGQPIQPALLAALVAGLHDNPLLQPVTASQMFQLSPLSAPAASSTASTTTTVAGTSGAGTSATPSPVRRLIGQVQQDVPGALQITDTVSDLAGLASMVPGDTGLLDRLDQQLLVAESDQISGASRNALLDSVSKAAQKLESEVKLIGASSVTLTARNVHLPLTIQGPAQTDAHVQLILTSAKLMFKTYHPPDGTCSPYESTGEQCQLVLRGSQTTLNVPVEARTTGVFTLAIALNTSNGLVSLDSATNTVRSTAVSAVGWILIFGAGLFLGVWWIRNIRNGRRARELVPQPEDQPEDDAADSYQPSPDPGPSEPTAQVPIRRSRAGGVSPSRQVGGHKDGAADRRNPEEIPT